MNPEQPHILFIGADQALMDAAVRQRLHATVVVGAAARDFGFHSTPAGFTELFVQDISNYEQVCAALVRAGFSGKPFAAVVTNDEFSVFTAAAVAERFATTTNDSAVLLGYRDKSLQKRKIEAAGIRTSAHIVIDDIRQTAQRITPGFGHHGVVVKPISGAATNDTLLVPDIAALPEVLESIGRTEGPRTVIVEDFAAGEEWIVDGILYDGEITFASTTHYGEPCLSAIDARRPVRMLKLDPDRNPELHDQLIVFASACIQALGKFNGIFHLELFRNPDDGALVFGECAARRGGGLLQEDTLVKHGVDLAEESLLASIGRGRDIQVTLNPAEVGSTLIPCPPGVLFSMPPEQDFADFPGVELVRIELPLGFSMGGVANTLFKLGGACMTATTMDDLNASMDTFLEWCGENVSVIPPNASTATLRKSIR
ncbi:hypothetical protein [Arthrobacter sp. UYCu712]|uniref:ATP-grasp domain-containing protein n=1 Tax=Arthrobacter sp. UYCu712 TaxID=3156340 RepID=UPI003399684E